MPDIDDTEEIASEPAAPEEPIDADFEPAPRTSLARKDSRRGPGWFGVAIASLLAAGAGGAIGIALDDKTASGSVVGSAEMADLRSSQEATDITLNKLQRDMAESENRLQEQMKTLLAGDGNREGLQALVEELSIVSQRLDEALAPGAAGISAEALEAIEARLDALEKPFDETGKASPREVTRALAALTQKLERIEAVQKEIGISQAERDAAVKQLGDRLTDIEFSGAGTDGRAGESVMALREEVDALKADLEAWRSATETSAGAASADIEKYKALIAAMQDKQDTGRQEADASRSLARAALALSSIEAAARRGHSFRADYVRLKSALPDERDVRALADLSEMEVPTETSLRAAFGPASEAALKAVRGTGRKSGWGWVDDVFGDVVTFRKGDESEAPQTILQNARAKLDEGDLAAAVKNAKMLKGKARDEMSDWIDQAEQRIRLEEGLERLRIRLAGAE